MLGKLRGRSGTPTGDGRFLVRGVGATAIMTGCSAGLAVIVSAFLARKLGASGYGAYAWALAWVNTLRIPALAGTDRLVTRHVARYRETRGTADPPDAIAWADRSVLRTSVPIAAAVGAGALAWHAAFHDHLTIYLAVAIPSLPIVTLVVVRQAALLADRHVAWALLPDGVIRPAGLLVLVVALALVPGHQLSTTTAILASIAAGVIALVVATAGAKRVFGAIRWAARAAKPNGWYLSGARIGASNTLIALSLQTDLLLIGVLRGPRDAGIYAVVTRGATLVNLPTASTLPTFSAVVASLHAAGNTSGLQQSLTRVSRWVFAATLLGCIALGALARPVLHVVTPGFESGATALQVLLLAAAVGQMAGFPLAVLTLTGFERQALRATGAGTVAGLVLGLALIPPLGASGAAIAALGRVAVRNGLGLIATWRHLSVDSSVFGLRKAPEAVTT